MLYAPLWVLHWSLFINERLSWAFSSGAGWTPSITTTGGCSLCLRLYKGHLLLQTHMTIVMMMIAASNTIKPAAPPIIPPMNLPTVLVTRDTGGRPVLGVAHDSSLSSPQLLILLHTRKIEIHLRFLHRKALSLQASTSKRGESHTCQLSLILQDCPAF